MEIRVQIMPRYCRVYTIKSNPKRCFGRNDHRNNIINDVKEEEMTLNEALSKMADLDKKINRTETKINSIEQEIKDYESKYSFVLVDGKSIIPKESKK